MANTPLGEADGLPNPAQALGIVGGDGASIDILVTNWRSSTATLYGWIDTNFDGVFDNETERASIEVPGEMQAINGDFVTLTFPSAPTGVDGRTYARFRISTDDAAANPTGVASDGEVEDYVVTITSPATVAVDEVLDFPPRLPLPRWDEYYHGQA